LLVEDSEMDAELVVYALRRGGFDPIYERVDTPEGMAAALDRQLWDVVIADYSMPRFRSEEALEMLRARGIEIPFISVSGTIGEEIAVSMMKAGAHDYVMKDNLTRLVPAIERELKAAKLRRERRQAEERARLLAAIVESSDDAITSQSLDGITLSWNGGAERMYGYTAQEIVGRPFSLLVPPELHSELTEIYEKLRHGARLARYETVRLCKDGRYLPVSLAISPLLDADGRVTGVASIARDISERKREESERMELIREMTEALQEVKTLSGLLPICAWCKKIRDDHGYWQQLETYIIAHSSADFTHGICPDCMQKVKPPGPTSHAKASVS